MPTNEELLTKAQQPAADALRWHAHYKGKVQMMPKCAVRTLSDFAVWYTPGVAPCCRAIQSDPQAAYEYTNKANSIAIISDGTRVLGHRDAKFEIRTVRPATADEIKWMAWYSESLSS